MKLKPIECPSCGAKLQVKPGSDYIECRSCGGVFYLDSGKTEHTYTKNVNIRKETSHTERYIDEAEIAKTRAEAKSDKAAIIGILSIFLLAVACFVVAGIIGANEEKEIAAAKSSGMISAGVAEDYIDMDYEGAEANLKGAGFTNIELVDLDDSGLRFWKNEKVESVSVGGDMHFGANDYFSPDAKVIITYH